MFRSFFRSSSGGYVSSLLKLYCNIHNLILFCKHGVVAACHVVLEYAVESAAGQVCVVCYVMRDWLAACHVVWEYTVESAAGQVCVVCYVMRDSRRSDFNCFYVELCKCNCWLITEVILRNARCNNKVYNNLLYIRHQSVPRCKRFSPRL